MVKYFVIVDILINFMGKVNVTLSPLIGKYVDKIQAIEFPSISFFEVTSPLDDGGEEKTKEFLEQKKKDQEELTLAYEKLQAEGSAQNEASRVMESSGRMGNYQGRRQMFEGEQKFGSRTNVKENCNT